MSRTRCIISITMIRIHLAFVQFYFLNSKRLNLKTGNVFCKHVLMKHADDTHREVSSLPPADCGVKHWESLSAVFVSTCDGKHLTLTSTHSAQLGWCWEGNKMRMYRPLDKQRMKGCGWVESSVDRQPLQGSATWGRKLRHFSRNKRLKKLGSNNDYALRANRACTPSSLNESLLPLFTLISDNQTNRQTDMFSVLCAEDEGLSSVLDVLEAAITLFTMATRVARAYKQYN